ncbi:ROK family transcriptional regulator [Chromohalobacter sarecensis]|nr:ROK family transcriptional regulator [Chromohalobacter sarecensis]MCK0715851.1 ROK family protein [Chromohalobacter sarecensis]
MVSPFAPQAAGDLNFLKKLNRSSILATVRRYPGATRADIASRTQLTKATVGSVVQALLKRGWLREGELQPRGGGRPGRALYLDDTHHVLLGADIGVRGLRIVACTLGGEVLLQRYVSQAPTKPDETAAHLAELIRAMRHDPLIADRHCLGLGVTVPGPVSPEHPILRLAPNLGWIDVAFLEVLRPYLPEFDGIWLLDNEANAAAFGEFYFHDGIPPESIVYISAASGIGSGLVTGDNYPLVLRGMQGLVGEIGHTIVQPGGLYCHCGNRGCAETLVSGWAIRAALGIDDAESLDAAIAARGDDPDVNAVLRRAGEALGTLMLNLHHTLNPAMLVLGGSLMHLGERLIEPALAYFEAHQNDLLRGTQRVPIKVIHDSTFTAARGAAAEVMAKAALEA